MPRFDPITARLVLALARDGSITRSAARENIAPSAVSRRIADLEARLGVALFDRTPQGVRPTAAGAAYAEGARRIFRAIADLEARIDGHAGGDTGVLRIAATSSALGGRLPELLARFAADHPAVRLDIRELPAPAALAALDDATVDLSILADNYDFSRFDAFAFEADRVWVIAAPDHPLAPALAPREGLRFTEAIAHEVVGFHQGGALDRLISEAARRMGRSLGERVRVESFPSLVRMVEAGFGIGFLRETSIHLLAGTALAAAPLAEPWAERRLMLARRKGAQGTGAAGRFADLCARTAPKSD